VGDKFGPLGSVETRRRSEEGSKGGGAGTYWMEVRLRDDVDSRL